jgi:predicted dehydrogenase
LEKIKAAVIGLGRIGSILEEDSLREKPCTHTGAIAANPDCVLAAGCDIDEERRRQYSEKWRVPVYADAAEMLRIHKPQILAIATHPDSHWHYCRLAARNGVPAVICEKPLADDIRQARKIARLAAQAGHAERGAPEKAPVIITNHERRYSQDYINAKAILERSVYAQDGGRLGRLLSVRANLCMGKTRRLLDVFWHDGTHMADAIMYLSGLGLKHRRRWGAKLNARAGTAWLEGELRGDKSKPAIPVIMEICAGRDHLVFEIEFSCEKGRLRIGNGIYEIWESNPSPYAENFRSLKRANEVFEGPTGYFANMLKDAAACLRESGRRPLSDAADGLRVIEYLNSVRAWR